VSYLGFVREKVKRRFLISGISEGNVSTPRLDGLQALKG